jgi:hypothetical protein
MGKIYVVLDVVRIELGQTYACPTNEPTHTAGNYDSKGMCGRCTACVGEDLLYAFVGDEVDAGAD